MHKWISFYKVSFACLVLFFANSVLAVNQIYQLRSNSLKQKVQIVVDMDTAPVFKAFALSNPMRLVVDIEAKASPDYKNNLSFKNRGVTIVRTGMQSANQVRLVLDMDKNYRWEVYAKGVEGIRGHRIVIDVYDAKRPKISAQKPVAPPDGNVNVLLESINDLDDPQSSGKNVANVKKSSLTLETVPLEELNNPNPVVKKPPLVAVNPILGKDKKSKSSKVTTAKVTKPQQDLPTVKTGVVKNTKKRTKKTQQKEIIIMIDPGHGGKDSGALGGRGTKEKDVVLQIAKRLKKKIDAIPNMRGMLTRSTDKYLTLRTRLRLARKHKADLFVSIHADAFTKRTASGSSVFILSNRGASSEAARWLARRENAVDLKYGVDIGDYDKDVSNVLMQIQQDATIESSYILAKKTLREMKRIGKAHKKHVERAGFAVLKSPDIPSMLVETAFISNPAEEKRLTSKAYQEKIAISIAKGIKKYFDEHLPHHLLLINTEQ